MKVPFYGLDRQYLKLKDELLNATDQALKEGRLVDGEFTFKFESWLSMKTGYPFALTVHSGTQALEMIARAENDMFKSTFIMHDKPKVIIPELTYIATLNAFLNAGYEVEIGEVDRNGLLDYEKYENEFGNILFHCPVGLYGAPYNHNPRWTTSLDVVDGAQHWLVHRPEQSTSMAISFDPTKNLPASGNGGAIVTRDRGIYEFALSYRNNGKNIAIENMIDRPGTNSKMSEQECAQILVRARYIDAWQKRRREIRIFYLDRFKDLPFRCLSRGFPIHADQKFVIYTQKRNYLQEFLEKQGIDTRIHYGSTLSEYPIAKPFKKPDMLSVGSMLARGVLSLPIYPEMTDNEVEYVTEKVTEFFT